MEITINGEKKDIAAPMTVARLLDSLGIKPGSVVVERNLKIVAKTEYEKEPVEEGDSVEIIRFVGGG